MLLCISAASGAGSTPVEATTVSMWRKYLHNDG
jgi:hypothetical protein